MKAIINMRNMFSSKKLSIADTAKVIQDKIMNITQVVTPFLFRTMLNNSVQSSASVTVLPESLVSTKSKPVKWSNSDPVSEVWPSTWKLTMSVSSSSVTTGILYSLIQINPIR
jgi:hypothetical protein